MLKDFEDALKIPGVLQIIHYSIYSIHCIFTDT